MKFLLFIFLLFTSFHSFAVYTITQGSSSCTMRPDLRQPLIGTTYASRQDAIDVIKSINWASTTCDYSGFSWLYFKGNTVTIKTTNSRNSTGLNFNGTSGCDFNECKTIATNECARTQTTLNQSSYFWRSSGDYDASCNEPPPPEPVKNPEECETLSNNSCSVRGGVSDFTFTDNNNFTYECTFTCGDGSTGDENGSHSGNTDGICNVNDPNDLIDCDVPITDPECVGCGAFTPDETTDLPYNPDGSTVPDGTGTDGITSLQGDVLINEVKKLKNENAKQTIKSANAISDAVADNNNEDKLQGIIDAVNNSGSGSVDVPNLNELMQNDNSNANMITTSISELTGTNDVVRNNLPSDGLVGFYESEYPLGVEGMFKDKVEEFKETEFYVFLEQFKPNFGGTPPNMSFCMNFGSYMNLGCFDLVLDPRIWPALKIFILITAGFTCRKILFGG
ncbi:hypothetical protein [Colwellia sp. MB02u-14]|uniref:hypothetical protein n=1 Tax=Colwellia sp. MB02u-14 TaxID=2759815 RepID=UPI0015F4CDCA|nr:hypothetical protein [Colwellia sp. MB02u-14]MBA6303200.1 hypothetical protein [Colwellia sp. MB02u-14]